jgi:hypothetical protein
MHTKFWLESLNGRNHSEGLDVNGRIILKWMLGKQDGRVWVGFSWLMGTLVNTLRNFRVPYKAGKFLTS